MIGSRGFTLLEIIVSLILLGIMSVFGTLFIVSGIKGYLYNSTTASMNLKAQTALTRLVLELDNLTSLSRWDPSAITYTMIAGPASPQITRTIALVGTDLRMVNSSNIPTASDPGLIDNVSSFLLSYQQLDTTNGSLNTWSGAGVQNLYGIRITLTLNRTDPGGGTYTLTTMSTPRRNGQYNGPKDWNK